MDDQRRELKTWGGNKSVRLAGFDYGTHVPYHVVVRAPPSTSPFLNPRIAEMVCHELRRLFDVLFAYLGAFCLMPDHVHVLMSPDRSGLELGQVIGRFKGLTTNRSWSLGWNGRLWQSRYYDHIVRRSEDIVAVAKYIYENPDRKGLGVDYSYRWVDADLR